MTRVNPPLSLLVLAALCAPGCGSGTPAATPPGPSGDSAEAAPTAADARNFIEELERERYQLLMRQARASWVRSTHITEDTEAMAADADVAMMTFSAHKAREAQRFVGLPLDPELARKLDKVRLAEIMPGPEDPSKREALAAVVNRMQGMYGKGKYCPDDNDADACLDLNQLSERLATSRDPAVLLDAWVGWRTVSVPMRDEYTRFVELTNQGARDMGFADAGALWRSQYDMDPDAFAAEIDRLWGQVKPLYEDLHCYIRGRLSEQYGAEVAPDQGPIPAHLLGNMWAQDWSYLEWLAMPRESRRAAAKQPELTRALVAKKATPLDLVRYAEGFFVSLGLKELPPSFWERSMFVRPRDREVECHASAWSLDWQEDLRIKMCINVNHEDFTTVHHELGHIYYSWAYNHQPILFQDSANDGFHEALGDTIALSVTPSYLRDVGLVPNPTQDDVAVLMRRALDKVAFLPFGLVVDKWRWQVFSGEVTPDDYNQAWWNLRREYQGLRPPVERTEAQFDPGAKYHIPANVPYMRYFLAAVLQFQFHRALCKTAGHEGPLHQCSIFRSKEAGEKLAAMMALGSSRPWPDALELLTGQREMDATALLDYFAPLRAWLQQQNQGRTCGW
ncbi:M2 family metallopeptidase [Haliangium sp.]|uniref:M2 family metallopeptidase n=1 Tax=Haliangium sp. TaxID=2663208 RepID=UPI003D0E3B9D